METYSTLSAETFKSAFRSYPGGVSLITADAGGGPAALTATSVSAVSAEPPLLTFSLSARSSSAPAIRGDAEGSTVVFAQALEASVRTEPAGNPAGASVNCMVRAKLKPTPARPLVRR